MPVPVLNTQISPAQLSAINTAITDLINTLKDVAVVNLTKEERRTLSTIDNARMPGVTSVFERHAIANPALRPGYTSFADAENDYKLSMQLRAIVLRLKAVLEIAEDMGMLAEHEAYLYFLDFYANVQQASRRNVPGVDTVYDDLKRYFDRPTNKGMNKS